MKEVYSSELNSDGKLCTSVRKYRLKTFDTVAGQQHISSALKNAIKSNHLARAYLFCGPRGIGKTACARTLQNLES